LLLLPLYGIMSSTELSECVHREYGFVSGAVFDHFLSYCFELGPNLARVILATQPPSTENTHGKDTGYHEWVIENPPQTYAKLVSSGERGVNPVHCLNHVYVKQLLSDRNWPKAFSFINIVTFRKEGNKVTSRANHFTVKSLLSDVGIFIQENSDGKLRSWEEIFAEMEANKPVHEEGFLLEETMAV
jgi:hypothetical protein